LKRTPEEINMLGEAIVNLRNHVNYCRVCHNICDEEICNICDDPSRDATLICVVENIKEVMAIENTGQFRGLYHVLGGIISPMEGIGPNDLQIAGLIQRAQSGRVNEVILALSTTMEGDTTNFYIYRK
jgi:recombination protein RecR